MVARHQEEFIPTLGLMPPTPFGAAENPSLRHAGRPLDIEVGWAWIYTRGYSLRAPSEFALRRMAERTEDPQSTSVRQSDLKSLGRVRADQPDSLGAHQSAGIHRVTTWEAVPPDGITFHDAVYRGERLLLLGEERYRFMGGDGAGCIAEVVVLRKPVSFTARLGLILLPELSVRSSKKEKSLFDEIDDDYRTRK